MQGQRFLKIFKEKPLTFVFLVAVAGLYLMANNIQYVAKPGRLGPDFWPKTILLLIFIMCLVDLGDALKKSISKPTEERRVTDNTKAEEPTETKKKYPVLLYLGIALTLGYVLVVDFLGFFLTTFVYLVAFMYLGRYRRSSVIWISSFLGTLFLVFIFVKVVYVSLPIGRAPFNEVTYLIYNLLGIK